MLYNIIQPHHYVTDQKNALSANVHYLSHNAHYIINVKHHLFIKKQLMVSGSKAKKSPKISSLGLPLSPIDIKNSLPKSKPVDQHQKTSLIDIKHLSIYFFNRIKQSCLQSLVYVMYNIKLQERNIQRRRSYIDPILIEELNSEDEWLVETEEPCLTNDQGQRYSRCNRN